MPRDKKYGHAWKQTNSAQCENGAAEKMPNPRTHIFSSRLPDSFSSSHAATVRCEDSEFLIPHMWCVL